MDERAIERLLLDMEEVDFSNRTNEDELDDLNDEDFEVGELIDEMSDDSVKDIENSEVDGIPAESTDLRSTSCRKRPRTSTSDDEERLSRKKFHAPDKWGKKTRECRFCSDRSKNGGRKETNVFCATCSNQPALHLGACFEKYHTEKDYKP